MKIEDMKEIPVDSTYEYHGRVVNVRVDHAKTPSGEFVHREVVEHPGGVCIALEDKEGKFFLVSQWRYAQERVLMEFPAGKLEKGENPKDAILREVEEETGYQADGLEEIGEFVPTGAYGQETVHLYYAKQGKYVGQHFDEDENIITTKKTLEEIIEAIMNGEIIDGKTCVLAFKLKERKERYAKKEIRTDCSK
ncbi:MAG: NUDIX hydrolase [Solobacterium sp.]|nr:NUDIX hydrolase [Solobacterium sp.]